MWDDDERKGEGETRCWLIACSSRKAPRGPSGLTSPVEKFKYMGVTVTNINNIREEIKRRINMGNADYYSLEKI